MIGFPYKKKGRRTWRAKIRLDGETCIRDISLGTSDEQSAKARLAAKIREAEREAAGILAPKMQREAAARPLTEHLENFVADLEARGRDAMYIKPLRWRCLRLFQECGWSRLADIKQESFIRWRAGQRKAAKTLNDHLDAVRVLLNWLKRQGAIDVNPLENVGKVRVEGRQVRERRALTDDEARRLVAVAGPMRGAVYQTALCTGLRRGELRALTWDDVNLDGPESWIEARAAITKNAKRARQTLHPDAVVALRAIRPANFNPAAPVFVMPKMARFKKDLAAAGIAYRDAQGRVADFHSLRHTLATNLSRAGVGVALAMKVMRHSEARLTLKTYTDAAQLPTADVVRKLPGAGGCPQIGPQRIGAARHFLSSQVTNNRPAEFENHPENKGDLHVLASADHVGEFGKNGAGDGSRTHVTSLEGWSSTVELHPRAAGQQYRLAGPAVKLL